MSDKIKLAGREFDIALLTEDRTQIVRFLETLSEQGVIATPTEQRVVQAMRELRAGGEMTIKRSGRSDTGGVCFFMETRETYILGQRDENLRA